MISPNSSKLTTKLLPPLGPSISEIYHSSSPLLPLIFADAMTIRLQVFCTEQGCSVANELDEDDGRSWHWVAYDSAERPVGCIRLVPPPHPAHPNGFNGPSEKHYIKLTRLAVMRDAREKGLARLLCEEALGWAMRNVKELGEEWQGLVLVHAQVSVEQMWKRLGFKTDEKLGRWDEEGIEHLGMWRTLEMDAATDSREATE